MPSFRFLNSCNARGESCPASAYVCQCNRCPPQRDTRWFEVSALDLDIAQRLWGPKGKASGGGQLTSTCGMTRSVPNIGAQRFSPKLPKLCASDHSHAALLRNAAQKPPPGFMALQHRLLPTLLSHYKSLKAIPSKRKLCQHRHFVPKTMLSSMPSPPNKNGQTSLWAPSAHLPP